METTKKDVIESIVCIIFIIIFAVVTWNVLSEDKIYQQEILEITKNFPRDEDFHQFVNCLQFKTDVQVFVLKDEFNHCFRKYDQKKFADQFIK